MNLKSLRFRKKHQSDEMALQITSMADIFMIIMVFLLKSYATGIVSIQPTAGLKLPQASAESPELDAVQVEISENTIQMNSEPVMTIEHFKFSKEDVNGSGISKTLSKQFEQSRNLQIEKAKTDQNVHVDSRLIIVADQLAPYKTIQTVLASAAVHGFTDFKLAVVKKGE